MKVLVIDDDRELCELIRDYLAPLGYEVTLVHDGPGGAGRVLAERFDAVILDVMLPGADGFEVLHRIRRVSDVPVLMLTARAARRRTASWVWRWARTTTCPRRFPRVSCWRGCGRSCGGRRR